MPSLTQESELPVRSKTGSLGDSTVAIAPRRRTPLQDLGYRASRNPRLLGGGFFLFVIILSALGAPWIAPGEPDAYDIVDRLQSPGFSNGSIGWLGFDLYGGSVLTAMLYGARTSLYISFLTVIISISLGTFIGLLAGFFRGWVDAVLMRIVDLLMAFPGILLAMALAALMGPSVHNVVFAIAATGWTSSARLIRGQALSLREREYVLAAQAMGAKISRLLLFHVFPATLSPLIVQATFSLSGVIIVEAGLSFLGLGAQDGAPSWGALLGQGRTVLTEAPYLSIVPGLAIAILVLSLNFVGDALRDLLDPKQDH
jgi:peptide/nickel transport system permease protein